MQIKLVEAFDRAQLAKIKQLYRSAFPLSERKPFSLILKKRDAGSMQIFALETETGEFAGEAITILCGDLVLLDYFAISPQLRGNGAGSLALQSLRERYQGKRFLLEIEDTQGDSPNREERIRRKHFYVTNGMQPLAYGVDLFGVEMEIMVFDCAISFEEYHTIFTQVFGAAIASRIKRMGKESE